MASRYLMLLCSIMFQFEGGDGGFPISNVTLQYNVSDIWQWLPDIAGGYTVRTGYQLLTTQNDPLLDASDNLI